MRRQDIPTTIAELEKLLADIRHDLEAPSPPDVSGDVRARIVQNPVRSSSSTSVDADRSPTAVESDRDGDDVFVAFPGIHVDEPYKKIRQAETLKLVAGIIAFGVLVSVLVLVFRPGADGALGGGDSDDNDAADTAVVETVSPFPLMVLWDPADYRDTRRMIQPVDPVTLEPLPGYEPIELGAGQAVGYVEEAISPDGTTAVFVAHAPGDGQEVQGQTIIHLVDLVEWQAQTIDQLETPAFSSNPARPFFSPDGQTLFWFEREPLVMGEWTLKSYSLASGAQAAVATLLADFSILDARVIPSGERIAVLGVPIQRGLALPDGGAVSGNYTIGNAQVLLVDVAKGTIAGTIELDEVVAGSLALTDVEDADRFPVHNVSPGISWSDEGRYLFIAHADEQALTVVELERGAVIEEFNFDDSGSFLDRLANWLFPTVEAVSRAFSYGHAALLDGGQTIALASNSERLDLERIRVESATHAPVRLVEVDDGEVIWETDMGGVQGITRAPDGEHLLVHSYPRIFPSQGIDEGHDHFLTLLDADTGDVVNQLEVPGRPYSVQSSMVIAGEYVYIRVITEIGSEVVVVDPGDLSIIGRWQWEEGEPNVSDLIPLP